MAQAIILQTATPVGALVPDFEGQKVVDTTNDLIYIAYGLTNADWQEVGSGGGGAFIPNSFNDLGFGLSSLTINLDTASPFNKYTEAGGTLAITVSGPTDTTEYWEIHIYVIYTDVSAAWTVNGSTPGGTKVGTNGDYLVIKRTPEPTLVTAEWFHDTAM